MCNKQTNKQLACRECKMTMKTTTLLKQHETLMNKEEKIQCFCKRTFYTRHDLINHLNYLSENRDASLQCLTCNKILIYAAKKKRIRIIEKRKNGKECCMNSEIQKTCVTTDEQRETEDSEEEEVNQDQNAEIKKDNEEEQVEQSETEDSEGEEVNEKIARCIEQIDTRSTLEYLKGISYNLIVNMYF